MKNIFSKYSKLFLLLFVLSQCKTIKQQQPMKYKFNFYTEYHQFYIADKENIFDTSSSNFWSDDAVLANLAIMESIIGIGTHSYGNIKGELEILDKASENIDYKLYDHIVEGGINIKSGELQILSCPTSSVELNLKVKPGKYRVRIYGSNFASVKDTDLANDNDNDFYTIEIWPDNDTKRKVLKQYIEK